MKTHINVKRALRQTPAALAAFAGLAIFAFPVNTARAGITNPLSANPINADGAYSPANEWADIKPAWFTSNAATGATPVAAGTAGANSLLFAGLARDTPASQPELYLMYDFLGRTNPPTHPNEFLGSVSFPMTISGVSHNISVNFNTVPNFTPALISPAGGFYNVTVNLDGGNQQIPAATLGLESGLFVGTTPVNTLWGVTAASPFHTTPHLLIELGVPLDISPSFVAAGGPSSPFTPSGPDGYSPDPAFWNSNIVDNAGDPPASGGTFTINPDGSTLIVPLSIAPVPEPATVAVGLLCLGVGFAQRRRSAVRK